MNVNQYWLLLKVNSNTSKHSKAIQKERQNTDIEDTPLIYDTPLIQEYIILQEKIRQEQGEEQIILGNDNPDPEDCAQTQITTTFLEKNKKNYAHFVGCKQKHNHILSTNKQKHNKYKPNMGENYAHVVLTVVSGFVVSGFWVFRVLIGSLCNRLWTFI